MGHDPAPEIMKLQKENLAAFDKWVSANGKRIVPAANCAVIYAGYPEADLMAAKALPCGDKVRKMWEIIEVFEKQFREIKGCDRYDKLNDVLKRLGSPLPRILEVMGPRRGQALPFSNMLQCAQALTNPGLALIDKGRIAYVWDKLSEQYVTNSEGEVHIWEGRIDASFKQVNERTTMIRAELAALMNRKELPEATLKKASELVVRYDRQNRDQKIISKAVVEKALAALRASKGR